MPRYGKLSLVLVLLVTACHSAPDAKDTENTRMVADVRKAAAAGGGVFGCRQSGREVGNSMAKGAPVACRKSTNRGVTILGRHSLRAGLCRRVALEGSG